jgi:hypothetical protein
MFFFGCEGYKIGQTQPANRANREDKATIWELLLREAGAYMIKIGVGQTSDCHM